MVIVQRRGIRPSETRFDWFAAVGGGNAVVRRTALRRGGMVVSAGGEGCE